MARLHTQASKEFLELALPRILGDEKLRQFNTFIIDLRAKNNLPVFYTSFSKVVRLFGKAQVIFSAEQQKEALAILPEWIPPSSVDKLIRALVLLEIPQEDPDRYVRTVEELFSAADVGELVALYTALPVLPFPEKFIVRCMEGVRTNMGEVFEAVANNNVYPSMYLDEDAFNQLVLKCLFVGKPLYKITNLENRLNAKLAGMASDYAHERWAAHRDVNPELWKLVEPFQGKEKPAGADRFATHWKSLSTLSLKSQITNH